MSARAKAIVFFGIKFGAADDSDDARKFRYGKDDPERHETTPSALVYWGDPKFGVEAVAYGHYEYVRFGLAAAGTVRRGRDWEGQPLTHPDIPDGREAAVLALRAYCERYGLTWQEPGWWVVPYYG